MADLDGGALSSVLVGYQGQLNQMSMALLTGAAVLLYANRKTKRCLPITLAVLGGLAAGAASLFGVQFVGQIANDLVKKTPVDLVLGSIAKIELVFIFGSTILLGVSAISSEVD